MFSVHPAPGFERRSRPPLRAEVGARRARRAWSGTRSRRCPPARAAVLVPGGFSYGDYLRCGAMARFSPIMADVRALRRRGRAGARHLQRLPDPVRGGPPARRARAQPPPALRVRVRARARRARARAVHRRAPRAGQRAAAADQARRGRLLRRRPSTLAALERDGQVVLRYVRRGGRVDAPTRTRTAASRTSPASRNARGNVIGLMPHPEHAVERAASAASDGARAPRLAASTSCRRGAPR